MQAVMRGHTPLMYALVVSATLHIAAASLVLGNGHREPFKAVQQMAAVLQAAPTAETAVAPPLQGNGQLQSKVVAESVLPPLHHAPAVVSTTVEHVAMYQSDISSLTLTEDAGAAVDGAPDVVHPLVRTETVPSARYAAVFVSKPRPAYPPLARKLGIEGSVVIRVQVSTTGKPEQLEVAQSSGNSLLDEAALVAMKGAIFKPRLGVDGPIAHVVDAPLSFRLEP